MKLRGIGVALLVTLSAQASTTFTLLCAGRPTMQVSLMGGGHDDRVAGANPILCGKRRRKTAFAVR